MLTSLAVDGYRSVRSMVVPLAPLTVVTGPNGSGKSNLYRAMRLLASAGDTGVVSALAREGGLPSALWAGPEHGSPRGPGQAQGTRRTGPVAVRLGFGGDEFGYAMDLGIPVPGDTMFGRDPEIKAESVWSGPVLRPSALLSERRGPHIRLRAEHGWRTFARPIPPWASMLAEVGDPDGAPELIALREALRSWRFYDSLRTDADAPARRVAIGTRTPVLASDGSDLAAALQTIREQGGESAVDAALASGFAGARVSIEEKSGGLALLFHQPGLLRPLEPAELSDGTLRFVLWIAALLSRRPAQFLVLNEPETSLHPDLLVPLAELIADAATRSQIVVVSHASALVSALAGAGALVHELEKRDGETVLRGQGALDAPPWHWPKR